MNLTDAYRSSTPRKKKFRVGRGESSGLGKTSGRGHKGQKARAGVSFRPYFEGGQMPLVRRLPKRGFNNAAFRTEVEIVHLGEIAARFAPGEVVDPASLRARNLVRRDAPIKLLADGDLDRKLTIRVHRASKSAADKVAKAGGTLELIASEARPAATRPPETRDTPKG